MGFYDDRYDDRYDGWNDPMLTPPEESDPIRFSGGAMSRWYCDFETHVIQGFKLDSRPVCLGAFGPNKTRLILTPEEVVDFLRARLVRKDWVIGYHLAFDAMQFMACPGVTSVDVWEFLEAYADGRWICVRDADKLTSIQNGSYERRVFSLAETYRSYTGKSIADSKGSDHPIIGAYRAGAKKDQKNLWLRFLGEATRAYQDGDRAAGDLALARATEIVPLADTPWRYKYGLLAGIPIAQWPNEARRYVLADCEETAELVPAVCAVAVSGASPEERPEQDGYTGEDGLPLHTAFESAMDFALQLTAEVGFWVRPDYVAQMRQYAEETKAELQEALFMKGLVKMRTTGEHKGTIGMDAKEVQDMVRAAFLDAGVEPPYSDGGLKDKLAWEEAEALGEDTDRLTPPEKWGVKRDQQTLKECPGRKAEAYRAWQEAQRLCDVFMPILERPNLRTAFNSLILTTRTSSGADEENGGSEINSQNLKKEGGIQQAFRPPTPEEADVVRNRLKLPRYRLTNGDRYVFLAGDYASGELYPLSIKMIYDRTGRIGYEPGLSPLADDLMHGTDVLSKVAATELRVDYDYFVKNRKGSSGEAKKFKKARQNEKPVLYGAGGMMGPKTMAVQAFAKDGTKMASLPGGLWDVQGSIRVAAALLKTTLQLYPDLAEHRDRYSDWSRRYLAFCLPSWLQRGDCKPTEAGNFVFQPPVARMAKRAVFEVGRAIYRGDPDFEGCLGVQGFLHDELRLIVPESMVHFSGEALRRIMLASKEIECPGMTLQSQVVPVATEVMEKDAEPSYLDGRLIVTPNSRPVAVRPPAPWNEDGEGSAYAWINRGIEQTIHDEMMAEIHS